MVADVIFNLLMLSLKVKTQIQFQFSSLKDLKSSRKTLGLDIVFQAVCAMFYLVLC